MRNKFRIALLSMAAVGLVGCSDKLADESGGINPGSDDGNVYMSVAVALPTANTRSQTDDGGGDDGNTSGDDQTNSNATPDYEIGLDKENKVSSIVIVLATKDDKFITHKLVQTKNLTTGEAGAGVNPARSTYAVTESFSRSVIEEAYETLLKDNKDVHIYAFCNTSTLDAYFKTVSQGDDEWIHKVSDKVGADQEPIFFMSNASVREGKFPSTIAGWDPYNNENNAYPLTPGNPVRVERAAARFDYKDGSSDTDEISIGENSVTRYKYDLADDKLKKVASVALTKMSLVNMSKEYYNLRRVSDDGKDKDETEGNFEVGGAEKQTAEWNSNYVVDTDWAEKLEWEAVDNAPEYFNYTLFAYTKEEGHAGHTLAKTKGEKAQYNSGGWNTKTIHEILTEGNDDTWDKDNEGKTGIYKIWRYVTENTIPKGPENQVVSQSTGVVFKAAIIGGSDLSTDNCSESVVNALEASGKGLFPVPTQETADASEGKSYYYPTLYLYSNMLYADFKELVAAAYEEKSVGVLHQFLTEILGNWYLEEKVFMYCTDSKKSEGRTQLTVEICHEILNGVAVDEVGDDDAQHYDKGYKVNFETSSFVSPDEVDVLTEFKKLITDKKIAIYEAEYDANTGGGYYCYYFYWNRHNDNKQNTVMGPMEFATVRNNVYKLSVTKIGQLGHPTNPDNDPDPVDPEDPNEDDKVYLNVQVEVLPWVVRVNDIEF